jgi:3-oxoadipate enol-lactonase
MGEVETVPGEVPGLPAEVAGLPIPLGRRVHLPGRGTTFVREVDGPPGAPTVLLLHGWIASAGLNWFQAFEPLRRHFRVVAVDQRGHGRGIRSRRRFRLSDCADDAAALITALGLAPAIAVGYSMGGPVAELLWKRHRSLVDGLVLCATGHSFVPAARERVVFTSAMSAAVSTSRLAGLLAWLPSEGVRRLARPPGSRAETMREWAQAEMRRHDVRMLLEAGHAIGTFDGRPWIGEIDVPTAVLVTAQDRALPPAGQLRAARAIPGATVHVVDGGHTVCARRRFAPPLVEACRSVARRARR